MTVHSHNMIPLTLNIPVIFHSDIPYGSFSKYVSHSTVISLLGVMSNAKVEDFQTQLVNAATTKEK